MKASQKPSVFISSSVAGLADARALAELLAPAADTSLWTDTTEPGRLGVTESLFELVRKTDFAVAILGGDGFVQFAGSSATQARMNVVFELGLFLGSLGPSRVFVLAPRSESLLLPSDLTGLSILTYDRQANLRLDLTHAADLIRRTILQVGARTERAEDLFSCFISYSSKDRAFAEKLGDGLQQAGIRCWLDVKDLTIGSRWEDQIDRAITIHDKILLVLSDRSIRSQWVRYEVEKALATEAVRAATFLIPVRIDDAIFSVSDSWAVTLRQKQIGDFRDWRDGTRFNVSVSRLVRDLMISASVESRERSDA